MKVESHKLARNQRVMSFSGQKVAPFSTNNTTGVNGNLTTPLNVQTTAANSQPSTPSPMSPNTAKKKFKNFLSTVIRLADERPAAVSTSIRNLIQGIIDGTMQAEEFTAKLQKELNSAPQPYLVPFLKKYLPYLRYSLITKELTIKGVRPPPPGAIILPHPQATNLQQLQDYQRPDEGPSESQTSPITQIEDFGSYEQYYSICESFFKSKIDRRLLDSAWNIYSVNKLSSSNLFTEPLKKKIKLDEELEKKETPLETTILDEQNEPEAANSPEKLLKYLADQRTCIYLYTRFYARCGRVKALAIENLRMKRFIKAMIMRRNWLMAVLKGEEINDDAFDFQPYLSYFGDVTKYPYCSKIMHCHRTKVWSPEELDGIILLMPETSNTNAEREMRKQKLLQEKVQELQAENDRLRTLEKASLEFWHAFMATINSYEKIKDLPRKINMISDLSERRITRRLLLKGC